MTLGEAAVDDVVPEINERQVVPYPALPLPRAANHEARPAGATYRLRALEITVNLGIGLTVNFSREFDATFYRRIYRQIEGHPSDRSR